MSGFLQVIGWFVFLLGAMMIFFGFNTEALSKFASQVRADRVLNPWCCLLLER